PPGNNFVLQLGIYLVQLTTNVERQFSAAVLPATPVSRLGVDVKVNANLVDTFFGYGVIVDKNIAFPVIGDTLLQITDPNSVVGFNVQFPGLILLFDVNDCRVVFTRLQ